MMCWFIVIYFVKIFYRLDVIVFLEMLEYVERKFFLYGIFIDFIVFFSNGDFVFVGEVIVMLIF